MRQRRWSTFQHLYPSVWSNQANKNADSITKKTSCPYIGKPLSWYQCNVLVPAMLCITNSAPRSTQVSLSPNNRTFHHSPQGVQSLALVFFFKINKSLIPILQMKKIISLWAYGGGVKIDLGTIQNTPSFLTWNIQPQINQNRNQKTKQNTSKNFSGSARSLCNLFSSYSLSALLWTSGMCSVCKSYMSP